MVTTCSDVIDKLKVGDAEADCEKNNKKVEAYLRNNVRVKALWLSNYLNVSDRKLDWNTFQHLTTLIDIDDKKFYSYFLSEIRSK